MSFCRILKAGRAITQHGGWPQKGERIRCYEGADIALDAGSVALEVSSRFMPANEIGSEANMMRLSAVSACLRATLMREIGLSVETWSLSEWSRLMPDGKECHVLFGLVPASKSTDARSFAASKSALRYHNMPFMVNTLRRPRAARMASALRQRPPECRTAIRLDWRSSRQAPTWSNKVAGVPAWIFFQIVLMLGLGFPEISRRNEFSHDLSWPEP